MHMEILESLKKEIVACNEIMQHLRLPKKSLLIANQKTLKYQDISDTLKKEMLENVGDSVYRKSEFKMKYRESVRILVLFIMCSQNKKTC